MSIDPTNPGAANLIERAKNIILTPQAEWDRIAGEQADVGKLYIGYVLPLAAVAAAAGLVSALMWAGVFRVGFSFALVMAVLQVGAALVGVFVMAIVTNALAPNFGSVQDQGQAHKLAAYGATAGLLGGIGAIVPLVGALVMLAGAIYSLVLIYIGLPRLMKTPEDKRVGFFATIVIVCIVIGFVFNAVIGSIALTAAGIGANPFAFGQNRSAPRAADNAEIALPGGGSINLAELERAATQGGTLTAVAPERLQNFLPQSLPGGFARVGSSSASAMGTAQAEAEYSSGDARLTLTVMHMGAMGGIASMAGAMNVQENRQDADGYTRTQTIDGRVVTEEVNNAARSARYGVIGRGVAITAEGYGVTADQVRAAVDTVGVRRLESEFASN